MARIQRGREAGEHRGSAGSPRTKSTRLTGFEQVLIGLLVAKPGSGYDLKRFFATTPASVYQPSSGALYPALRRLERAGLLRTTRPAEGEVSKLGAGDASGGTDQSGTRKADATQEGARGGISPHQFSSLGESTDRNEGKGRAPGPVSATGRQRYVYQVTEQGAAVHAAWIREPVNPATVSQDLELHMMRFVMMERQLPRAEVLDFLASLHAALAEFVAGVERYLGALDPPVPGDMHGQLALEHGIDLHRASLDWTERAIAALTRASV